MVWQVICLFVTAYRKQILRIEEWVDKYLYISADMCSPEVPAEQHHQGPEGGVGLQPVGLPAG